ncbi:MAG TPA: FAD-binding oxidoreductase [Polyangiales bacterium]|nr:FAD-binding oxidoreductase [Polyangiales bacterium]
MDNLVELAGWGANLRSRCKLVEPEVPAELRKFLNQRMIARGLGRSYGDPALNAGGLVVGMRKLDRFLDFDENTGILNAEAGVSLLQIIHSFGPRGFFPMISPGTQYVTIGGCIANDIHGKAHHSQGSFANSVESMRVLLANGEVVSCSRSQLPDLFWASFGGMGLLGIILSAEIKLRRVETAYYTERFMKLPNLDELMTAIDETDKDYAYSVATVDVYGRGPGLGRGVCNMGNIAALSDLPPELQKDPLRIAPEAKLVVPFEMPEMTLNPLTIRMVNAYAQYKQSHKTGITHYTDFTYPLDIAQEWYRVYGPRGFTQYQFVIPFKDGHEVMHSLFDAMTSSGEMPNLNVLKRMGKQSEGLLSFPTEGYTLAIDFPVRSGTVALTRRLDAMVLEAGGRIYLGKDSYVEPDTFRKMYPRLDEWLAIKAKYDPENIFVSDLSRRVGLTPF